MSETIGSTPGFDIGWESSFSMNGPSFSIRTMTDIESGAIKHIYTPRRDDGTFGKPRVRIIFGDTLFLSEQELMDHLEQIARRDDARSSWQEVQRLRTLCFAHGIDPNGAAP